MERKTFNLISGIEDGFSWRLTVKILKNGTFHNKGVSFNIRNNKIRYLTEIHLHSEVSKEQRNEYMKKYRKTDKNKKYMEEFRITNKKHIKKHQKEYNKKYHKEYRQTDKGRESIRRQKYKRRDLDFNPLNNPFENSHAHHINKEEVIYIPKELHDIVRHDIWTDKNMDIINDLAHEFLLSELGEC